MKNELIKQLEKQCWNNQTNHLDTEKFAELIIAECVAAIMTSEQQAFLDRREYFAAVVQYHFGINDEQTN